VTRDDPAITRACAFLLRKQRADGGWGEDGDTCRERRWVEARDGQVVQTSWALLTLLRAGVLRDGPGQGGEKGPLHRAAAFLVERQDASGGWPKEPLVGVFNRTCLIDYDNYRQYFPLWALSEYVVSGT
jgi:squalene cyclase